METTKVEVWKDVPNYEGAYKVSSLGRVKSLPREVKTHQGTRKLKERYMANNDNGNGYKYVDLSNEGVITRNYIHRLVAYVFIPNPEEKPEVNHKNGDKADNRAENLEWSTRRDNEEHAYDTGLKTGSISEIDVIELEMIKDLLRTEKYSFPEIRNAFSVSEAMIEKIRKGTVESKLSFEDVKRNKLSNGYKTIVYDKQKQEEKGFVSSKQASEYYGRWDGYFSELNRKYGGENEFFKVKYIDS